MLSLTFTAGQKETTVNIPSAFVLKCSLGLLALAVASLWLSPFLPHPYSFYILFGSLAVLCMGGLLGLVGALVCLLIIFCSSRSTVLD